MSKQSTYPWSTWFAKEKPFTIKAGKYTASQNSMAVMVRQNARLHGVRVSVLKQDNGDIKVSPKGQRPQGPRPTLVYPLR